MSPRSDTQNQALRDATRTRILDGALRSFARNGFEGASVRLIAKEADVALGLLYRHFTGKEDLLRSIFERSMDDVRESFQAAGPSAAAERVPPLALLIRSAFAILRRNLAFWKLSYGVRMQESALKALGPEMQAWTGQIIATLEAHFRAAGAAQPQLEAAILFASIDGISQHYALDPARYPLDAVADTLIAKYTVPTAHRKASNHGKPHPRGPADPRGSGRRT
jgi:AcrR family transcriptional regulator